MKSPLPPVRFSPALYAVFETHARRTLEAVRSVAHDGTAIYMPDDSDDEPALWTRDFCYLVEGAGHLIPAAEILAAIDYLLAGQSDDGTIPERVYADGRAVYLAGAEDAPLGNRPPTDNSQFMAKLLCAYVNHTGDHSALDRRMEPLMAAMDSVPLSRDALVYIDPNSPHAGYGFTNCVGKTGKVFFSSVLYWEACQKLGAICARFEYHEDAHYWYEHAEAMADNLNQFMDESLGLFVAASEDCQQVDIWGNAYAAVVRVASKTQMRRIARFFLDFQDQFTWHGFIRHLPEGQYWERLLADVRPGTHQNGGYWPLPAGWVAQTIATVDEDAARALLAEVAAEIDEHGVREWISPQEQGGGHHTASAAALLGSVQSSKKL